MSDSVAIARQNGYTDEEINEFLKPKIQQALSEGYTLDEINKHLGIKPPPPLDEDKIRAGITDNLRRSPKPVTSFAEALEAGLQISVAGLMARGEMPNKQVAADAPWYARIAGSAATMAGDIPAMLAGFGIGAGTMAPSGPGAVVGGMAGAFGLPAGLRATLIDAYEKGQFDKWEDAWPRVAGIFMDTAKGWVTGAATGGAGLAAGAALPATASGAVRAATTTAAEVATMVTVGSALEGHVPAAQDFVDAAILLGGFKFAMHGAARLRQIYVETGIPPKAVVADAARDPTIVQDLAGKEGLPRAYEQAMREEMPPDAAVRATETPVESRAPEVQPAAPEAPRTLEQAQDAIRSHISIGAREEAGRLTWDRFYTMTMDRLHPLEKAVQLAGKELGPNEMPAGPDPYKLGRNVAGSAGVAYSFIEFGTRDFRTGAINGPALRSVLEPVARDLDAFRVYATSARALELEARDIRTGFDLDAARIAVEAGNARPEFKAALDQLIEFQNKTAEYLRDSGVLSRAGYEAMREANQLYVPFQRVMDEGSAIGIRISPEDMQARNPVRRIEGSQRVVIDPLESIIRNTHIFAEMAQRNEVGLKLVDLLRAADRAEVKKLAEPRPEVGETVDALREAGLKNPEALSDLVEGTARPVRVDEIRVFRDGKAETYQVTRDLAEAFRGLDVESANLLERIIAAPARTLRAGATLTPDFMARNVIRDFLTAMVNTSRGVFTPIDTMRGLAGVLRRDKDYQDWYANGGANAALMALDRNYLQTNLQTLTAETGLMSRSWNVVRHPIDTLRMLSQISEEATRLGVYKKMVEGGSDRAAMQEAVFASREATLDFARMGSKMRAANMIVAFLNANLQGTDRIVRAFRNAPVGTSMRIAAGITVPSLLLWWANHEDPRYQNLPNWQKDLFWIVMTDKWEEGPTVGREPYEIRTVNGRTEVNNGYIFRIPKPFEVGIIFGTGPERIMDAYFANKPDAFKGFAGSIAGALAPSVVPTIAMPIVGQFANRDLFRGHTLVPFNMEKMLPEYQYTPYTTDTAKALGQLIGAFPGVRDASLDQDLMGATARAATSPILIENYVRAWTGGLGMYALGLADASLRKAGLVPEGNKPASKLAETPFVRAFMIRYPSASAQPIQDFQDDYKKSSAYFLTWQAMAMQNDPAAMAKIQAAGGPLMFTRLSGIEETLSEQSHIIQWITRDPSMPPAEKRQLIDQLYYTMIQISKHGNDQMRQLKATIAAEDAAKAPVAQPRRSLFPMGAGEMPVPQ